MSESTPHQSVKIVNVLGLHARAAGKFVTMADQFKARVTVKKDAQVAGGDSVMELMMLTASQGDTVIIETSGPDADKALKALVTLVEQGFGEATK